MTGAGAGLSPAGMVCGCKVSPGALSATDWIEVQLLRREAEATIAEIKLKR